MTVQNLPALNACLNGTAAVFLLCGWIAIKRGKPRGHRAFMVAAFSVSALFLCSYLTYHFMVQGVTRYGGEGAMRGLYLTILASHSFLAMLVPPASIAAVWFAFRQQFARHVRVTRWLWPIWMYVSVTGVVIYLMLYVF